MSDWEKTTRQTQDMLERLHLLAGLGAPRLGVFSEELVEVAGGRDVWASLLKLLPPRPNYGLSGG